MKNARRAQAVATIVSILAGVSCESTQPTSVGTRQATVSFTGTAVVGLYNCYDVYQDESNPPDGIPDTFVQFLCEPHTVAPGGPIVREIRALPWRYSIKITVVPAGGVNEVVVLSSDSAIVGSSVEPGDIVDDFESMTAFDTFVSAIPDKSAGDLYFVNGQRVSNASPVYLSFIGIDPGVPNILTEPEVFPFTLNTGDTVIVRARKQPFGQAPPFLPPTPDPSIKILASLAVSGVVVTTEGSTESATGDSAGITFSFTVQ